MDISEDISEVPPSVAALPVWVTEGKAKIKWKRVKITDIRINKDENIKNNIEQLKYKKQFKYF